MIKFKTLLVNIFFSRGKRVFIYLVQDDLSMVRLTSEALRSNMHIFPGSVHVVLPVYGIYIFNPLKSKYPKKLKKNLARAGCTPPKFERIAPKVGGVAANFVHGLC